MVTLETQNLPTSRLPLLNMGAVSILGKYGVLNKQENVGEGKNKIRLRVAQSSLLPSHGLPLTAF